MHLSDIVDGTVTMSRNQVCMMPDLDAYIMHATVMAGRDRQAGAGSGMLWSSSSSSSS